MEINTTDAEFEDREEGEIVEDDLEDVSDCSMTSGSPFCIGKSVSPPELLSAVCLSSVSSSEYSAGDRHSCVRDPSYPHYGKDGGRRRPHKRKRRPEDRSSKRKRCHQPRHTRKLDDSDTDSVKEVVDPKYAKKLRVALRRESTHDLLHNSLRTRLKAFIEPGSHSEDELSLSTLRDLALLSTLKSTENLDKPVLEVESEDVLSVDDLKDEEHLKVNDDENSVEFIELSGKDLLKKDESREDDKKVKTLDTKAESQGVEGEDQAFDSELRELRIAALKSFVLENHKRRRRKAAINNRATSIQEEVIDVDKENDKSIINNDLDGKCSKKVVNESDKESVPGLENPIVIDSPAEKGDVNLDDDNCTDCGDSLEDDADILRTMLLASMSKKLAGKTIETDSSPKTLGFPRTLSDLRKVEKSKINHNSLSVTIAKPFKRTIKNDLYSITNTNKPTIKNNCETLNLPTNVIVKPLIINVNADSDSDTENTVIVNESNKALKATVAEFLKKQRAEVEASVKTKPSPVPNPGNKSYDPLMEKSVMRLLPQSQQLEYRRLKQQLINARKKKRIRKPSQRLSESKREITKKVPKVKTDISTNNFVTATTKTIKNSQEKKTVEPAGNLQKALNELQIRKNGRLQMKGKYRSLAPLLQRINQASYERRQHEIEIKKLLLQIQKARMKLATSHQGFTALVHQLLCEKNTIDQRVLKMVTFSENNVFTSTPNKLVKKISTCDISLLNETSNLTEVNAKPGSYSTKINTNTPAVKNKIQNVLTKSEVLERTNQNNVSEIEKVSDYCEVVLDKNDKKEKLDSNDENEETSLTLNEQKEGVLLDPNDIMKGFVEQPMIESLTFPKYTSPLHHHRDGINNPLTTFCPYDLLGVCKDKECRYMHCS